MRQYGWLILILIMCVMMSGCTLNSVGNTKTTNPPKSGIISPVKTTSTSIPVNLKYHIGDIVKPQSSVEDVGRVILDYSPSSDSYKTRFVFFDNRGNMNFLSYEGDKTFKRQDLESLFPILRGHMDNPNAITIDTSKKEPKYKIGTIVSIKEKPPNGLVILDFNPLTDLYRVRSVAYIDGVWKYDESGSSVMERADVEINYPESRTTVKIDSFNDTYPKENYPLFLV